LAKEISLENDYTQARKVFLGVSKKVAKEANQADFDIDEINSPEKPKKKESEFHYPEE
jgi:hypothetical protein